MNSGVDANNTSESSYFYCEGGYFRCLY